MKSAIECVGPGDSAETAAQRMRDHNVGFLPVCNDELRVVGTLTDRDIALRVVAEHLPGGTPVETIMTRDIVACRPSDDIQHAEELMGLFRVGRILCTEEDGTLTGVLSLSDVAAHESSTRVAQTLKDVTLRERHP
ncbi:MAG TPA: CBS domain-containing protein [Polyangiaceae bacterium]|nr:CBS domain-containing protein [Polyangiaceae bacterium]